FSWVFFLATKDETSGMLQNFIRQIENQLNHRVKIIRSDNDTEFKNRDMLEFYTLSVLGKFDGKCDEGFLVGYSLNSKAFRVYNLVTKKVEVNLHVKFLKEKPNVKGVGYRWMFDIDYLTDSMNYIPVSLENKTNPHAGTLKVTNSAGTLQTPNANASEEEDEAEELIVVPTTVRHKEAYSTGISEETLEILDFRRELDELALKHLSEVPKNKATSTTSVKSGSGPVNSQHADQDDSDIPELTIFNKPQKGIFDEASYDDEGMVHDFNNLPTEVAVSPVPTLRIHNIHPQSQILGDPKSSVQTRSKVQQHSGAYALFRLQQVWILVDLPHGAKEEVIDYAQVFTPMARIEAIRLVLAFASFMGFIVHQMDVKSAFLYGTIDEEVYVSQPPGFVDPDYPKKVYKVVKALYGLHQAPRAWYATLSTFLEKHGYRRGTIDKTLFIKKDKKDIMLVQVFQMSSMGELIFFLGLQVKQKTDGIFISQDKYVAVMLKKFDLTSVKTAITPIETKMALTKDEEADEVDVTPKTSHLNAVKRHNPTIHDSLVKQFWQTATASTLADGTLELRATIDTLEYTITEASVRSKLQLADASGISMLPNTKIFEGMGNIGPKSGGWDQFGSNLATALICLSTGRIYNFSKLIFDGMVANLKDQSAGPADQVEDQPSSSAPLTSSSHPPVISATITSEPTPVAETTTHHTSPSPELDNEPTEHIFEQPSPEHQPLSPRQEPVVPQS
ncbi:putative ribonuclease H-like domain-containing protein, partial [Tanacetum coccineum]